MALLERVNAMKEQGFSEDQVTNTLVEEGFSPLEINESISQSRIKAAVSQNSGSDMQPSMMESGVGPQFVTVPEERTTSPSAPMPSQAAYEQMPQQEAYAPEPAYSPEAQQQPAYTGYEGGYAPQQQYSAYPQDAGGQYYPQVLDIETVRDISKQYVEESLRSIRSEISMMSKMKTEIKFEMQDIENRLAKIESVIQELQSAVLRKMGEYGEAISGISDEIRATQDSFSKVINPLMDKKRGLKQVREKEEEIEEPEETPQEQAKPQKMQKKQPPAGKRPSAQQGQSGASFEDYFR